MTLRRYAEGWARGWRADSTRGEKIRSHLANHIIPELGGHTLAQLAGRPSIIQQWLSGLPLSSGAAGQVFITLSSVLSAAADDGLIARNPCKTGSVRSPKQGRRKVVPWTVAEIAALRAALPGRWRAMVDCGAGLGLRQGEILDSARIRSTSSAARSMCAGRSNASGQGHGSPCRRAAGSATCHCPHRWRSRCRKASPPSHRPR